MEVRPTRQLVITGIIFALNFYASGYQTGAPMSTCLTRYPKHGASTQQQPVPFIIQLSQSTYTAGTEQLINVTVRGTAGHGFKGLQMAAFKASNEEEAVGTFQTFDATKYRAFTCHGGYKDSMITHINNLSFE
ncbi:putative defense protein 3 [Physella acuta]|uniref:putative defense protein 3 n=1 Tax=Physella acuta TaxID=109671 RepID=UPI0027DCDACF|nr:putative defense protein 3 [Physella acuta]